MERDKRTNQIHEQPFEYTNPFSPISLATLFTITVLLNGQDRVVTKVNTTSKDSF